MKFLQIITGKESLRTNLLHFLRQQNLLQMMARMKSILRDDRTSRFTQIYISELPAKISHLPEIRITLSGQVARQLQGNRRCFLFCLQAIHVGYSLCEQSWRTQEHEGKC